MARISLRAATETCGTPSAIPAHLDWSNIHTGITALVPSARQQTKTISPRLTSRY